MAMQRGLGTGLGALFQMEVEDDKNARSNVLPLNALIPNAAQPRKVFTEEALQELASSIRAQGIAQPLLVRPIQGSNPQQYEIVAGERRWRAAKLAGLIQVPVHIRELTDENALAIALVENLQREDLNPMEEAQALAKLKEQFSLSQEELASRIGKSRSAVANSMRLLQLSDAAKEDLFSNRMTQGHARALLAVEDEEAQEILRIAIVSSGITVREAEEAASFWKKNRHFPSALQIEIPTPAPASPRQKAPELKELQRVFDEALQLKLSISGTLEKGKITLPFRSQAELQDLIKRLGLEIELPEAQAEISADSSAEAQDENAALREVVKHD